MTQADPALKVAHHSRILAASDWCQIGNGRALLAALHLGHFSWAGKEEVWDSSGLGDVLRQCLVPRAGDSFRAKIARKIARKARTRARQADLESAVFGASTVAETQQVMPPMASPVQPRSRPLRGSARKNADAKREAAG
jgi:hypothetical protein